MKKISLNKLLGTELAKIIPSKEDFVLLNKRTSEVVESLRQKISKFKIKAQVFIGGSFAKNTLIKKDKYDVDIFVRFSSDYNEEELSGFLKRIVPSNSVRIHGSRDYFILKDSNGFEFEIIPTLKINKPENAKNITDLSYFHVNYVLNELRKKKNLADEIRMAKAFLHYSGCYGAESYIMGFSGYAVELLVIYYGGFINFIKAISKMQDNEKIILDPAKFFKNKQEVLRNMNESKLQSPIVLVDPTFKSRNALAALSSDTFIKFRSYCKEFLASPSEDFFRFEDAEREFRDKYKEVIELNIKTDRQAGDIAGTKLKKFYGFFIEEVKRFFEVKDSLFLYDEDKNLGKILFSAKQKKELIFSGPPVSMKEQFARFKREHKNIKIKNGNSFAIEKSLTFKEFLSFFQNKKSNTIESMGIVEINLI